MSESQSRAMNWVPGIILPMRACRRQAALRQRVSFAEDADLHFGVRIFLIDVDGQFTELLD